MFLHVCESVYVYVILKKNKFLKFSKHVSCLCTHDTSEDEVFTDNQKEADYFCLTSASLASSHESPFPQTFLLLDLLLLWFPIELSKSQTCFIL